MAIVGEAALGAMIVLAAWAADDVSVARAVSIPLHLVNTLFLLAALTLTAFWLSEGRRLDIRAERRVVRIVAFGGLAHVLIAASGAVTALADTLFPSEPFIADFDAEAHFLTRLRIVHQLLAIAAASAGWWAARRSAAASSRAARSLPVLAGLMLLSGGVNVLLGVPLWMQPVHLALADGLWIAYVLASAQALEVSDSVSVG